MLCKHPHIISSNHFTFDTSPWVISYLESQPHMDKLWLFCEEDKVSKTVRKWETKITNWVLTTYLMLSMCYLMPEQNYESCSIAPFYPIQEWKIREPLLFVKVNVAYRLSNSKLIYLWSSKLFHFNHNLNFI